MESTLVLIKPDGVKRGLVGEIISFYERKNLKIAELKMVKATREEAENHYSEHKGRAYYDSLIDFLISDQLCALVIQGDSVIEIVRAINGDKDPLKSDKGSIRGKYSSNTRENLVHASDSPENAKKEIGIWFPNFNN